MIVECHELQPDALCWVAPDLSFAVVNLLLDVPTRKLVRGVLLDVARALGTAAASHGPEGLQERDGLGDG
jgi:hypothetical protein